MGKASGTSQTWVKIVQVSDAARYFTDLNLSFLIRRADNSYKLSAPNPSIMLEHSYSRYSAWDTDGAQ